VAKGFGVFGRYSYGVININPRNLNRLGGDVKVQSFQAGLAFQIYSKKERWEFFPLWCRTTIKQELDFYFLARVMVAFSMKSKPLITIH
jgi:hypothetical protein